MKYICIKIATLFILTLTSLLAHGQYGSCTQSTAQVNQIFYPNTSTVYTSTVSMEWLYLCGSNTIVYDTAHPLCRQVLLESGTTYITNSQGCPYADFIYAKSSSTVIIKANGNPATFRVIYELGATIIDQTGSAITSTCSALNFPVINCSVGISEISEQQELFYTYPNPSCSKINIDLKSDNNQFVEIKIANQLGETVFEQKKWLNNEKSFSIDNLISGSYFIHIKTKLGQQTRKLIVVQ